MSPPTNSPPPTRYGSAWRASASRPSPAPGPARPAPRRATAVAASPSAFPPAARQAAALVRRSPPAPLVAAPRGFSDPRSNSLYRRRVPRCCAKVGEQPFRAPNRGLRALDARDGSSNEQGLATDAASVLNQKFLYALCLYGDGAATEPPDGGQDVVGGFGPAERLWISVAGVDVGGDGGLQLGVERCAPRRICCSVSKAKKRSTWLIHDAEVGV